MILELKQARRERRAQAYEEHIDRHLTEVEQAKRRLEPEPGFPGDERSELEPADSDFTDA
jgi:hypothetical protein